MKPFFFILGVALLPAGLFANSPKAPAPEAKPPAYRIIHSRTGKEMTLAQVADDLAARDVVYFGELHDNIAGHRVYAQLAKLLADRRPDFVLSMEMFERDVQGVVNDYLRGRIDEAAFLKYSRPWKNYARDYRPLVELARERKRDVIAGNLPRPVAAKVASKEGSMSQFLPRVTTAPLDRYWELFGEAMKDHPRAEGASVERMYRAQCAKDDAMAEGIAEYLATSPHRQPLVIHCNGNFHSDYGLGTASRLAQRAPLAQSAIISMIAVGDVAKADVTNDRKKAHYLLVVAAPQKTPEPAKPALAKDSPSAKIDRIGLWHDRAPIGDGTFERAEAWLTAHRPEKPNGTAIVICPGGGYAARMVGPEGHGIAAWLNGHGITGAVLEYRLPAGRSRVPLLDAQRAIRTVRANAKNWNLDPSRIGIMGFSAGGHLASTAGTHFDDGQADSPDPVQRVGCRPDFMILIYPVITMGDLGHAGSRNNLLGKSPVASLVDLYSNEKQVTPRTPPTLLAHAKDDKPVPPENSRMFYAALRAHNVASRYLELPSGGHGLNGYKGPMWDAWQKQALIWLAEQKLIP